MEQSDLGFPKITEAGKINYGGAEEGKQGTQVRDYDGSPGKKCW